MESTVYFRAFEPEDAVLIHEWKNSDELNKLTVGLNKKTCFEEDKKWVEDRMAHNPFYAYWAICAKDTNKMIGWCCLTEIHYINSSANFSGIMIGNKDYQDGFAWVETYRFVLEYVFERLNLHRMCGSHLVSHKQSDAIARALFIRNEGIQKEAIFKNAKYEDLSIDAILADEYFAHREAGDYEFKKIVKRLINNLK